MAISDYIQTILIFVIFALLFLFNILAVGIKKIKEEWPLYRCNPVVMPFAGYFDQDVTQNFTYCIQNMQTISMGNLLQPLNYATQVMGNTISEIKGSVQYVREFFNKMRNFISDTISSIMSVFLNLLLGIVRIIIIVLDLFGRLIGVVNILGNIVGGSNNFSQSVWNGPPGQTTRAIGSICFSPNNLIKKHDGKIIKMKNIKLGDKLKSGNKVIAKLYLNNYDEEKKCYIDDLYKIKGGERKKSIIVSGSHLIFDKDEKKFIFVKNYYNATKCKNNLKKLFCLITDNHIICLGNKIMHDWEDNKDTLK